MADMTMGQLASKLSLAADKMGPVSDRKLETLAQVGVGYVKDEIQGMHAVLTGTMLNSTVAEKAGAHLWLVGPTVFYAPYVALGTSRMDARPFHLTAARRLQGDIKDFMSAEDIGL